VFAFAIDFSKKNWGKIHPRFVIECVFPMKVFGNNLILSGYTHNV